MSPFGRIAFRIVSTNLAAVAYGLVYAWLVIGDRFPASAGSLGQMGESFNEMVAGLREREHILDTFGRYVTPAVMKEALAGRLTPGGEARDVTILFADIRGFTTMAEERDPAEVVALLNSWLDVAVGVVLEHEGTLDKFIGDAVMAIFGAPIADPEHARQAVETALDLNRRLATWNREHPEWPDLEIAVGIHTGKAIAGNIGASRRMEYTVIGDAVNVAARIERLCRKLDRPILIGEPTAQALGEAYALQDLAEEEIAGKARRVRIFAVEGRG